MADEVQDFNLTAVMASVNVPAPLAELIDGEIEINFDGETTTTIGSMTLAAGGSTLTTAVESALEALSNIGSGNVSVSILQEDCTGYAAYSGNQDVGFRVTFQGALAGINHPQMTITETIPIKVRSVISMSLTSMGGNDASPSVEQWYVEYGTHTDGAFSIDWTSQNGSYTSTNAATRDAAGIEGILTSWGLTNGVEYNLYDFGTYCLVTLDGFGYVDMPDPTYNDSGTDGSYGYLYTTPGSSGGGGFPLIFTCTPDTTYPQPNDGSFGIEFLGFGSWGAPFEWDDDDTAINAYTVSSSIPIAGLYVTASGAPVWQGNPLTFTGTSNYDTGGFSMEQQAGSSIGHQTSFTISTSTQGGTGSSPIETTVDPITLTLTPLAPTSRKLSTIPATTLALTPLAPTSRKTSSVPPLTLTLSALPPTSGKVSTVSPATLTLAPLTPTSQKITTVSPLAFTLTTLTPASRKVSTVDPAALAFTALAPTSRKLTTLDSVQLVLTALPPDTGSIVTTLDPIVLTLTALAPGSQHRTTIAPVAFGLAPLAPSSRKVTTAGIASLAFTTLEPTSLKRTTVAPLTFTLTAMPPAGTFVTTVSPAVLSLAALAPTSRKVSTVSPLVLTFTLYSPVQNIETGTIFGRVRLYDAISGNVEFSDTINGQVAIRPTISGTVEIQP
ncbi:hypothetical protein NA78x_001746 [Anatilimnocola sp. NA78]|uniref:hypothetical protein n=1 Tax=Anatilimnocola sp. NA78 TaxID=3415683 RepID=UPI003CE504B3